MDSLLDVRHLSKMADDKNAERIPLKIALGVAALCAVILLALGIVLHSLNYQEASHNAASYSSNTYDQIWAECTVIPLAQRPKCKRDINDSARKEQREEYDLYSQKVMAIWTAIMGGVAVFGVALSGVGVWLIYGTFKETGRVLAETQTANIITKQSIKDANEPKFGTFAVRLYLTDVVEEFYSPQHNGMTINYRNEGNTQAYNLRISCSASIFTSNGDCFWKNDNFVHSIDNKNPGARESGSAFCDGTITERLDEIWKLAEEDAPRIIYEMLFVYETDFGEEITITKRFDSPVNSDRRENGEGRYINDYDGGGAVMGVKSPETNMSRKKIDKADH